MKKKSVPKTILRIIGILILLVVLALAVRPSLFAGIIGQDAVTAIEEALKSNFAPDSSEGGEPFMQRVLPKLISLVILIGGVSLLAWLIRLILTAVSRKNRSKTVAGLIISFTKYAAWLVVIVWGLSILGVNVTGIFASLGILGLVVGFGAQSLIEDIITGIFIIFEGQYNVGDIIILDDFRGEVKRIGVRTTDIQDLGGNLKIVNNSDIRNFQNRSQNLSWAVCDVGVSYSAPLAEIEAVLERELPRLSEKEPRYFTRPIAYRGVQDLGASAVILRVVGEVMEKDIFNAQRFLNREIKLIFDENGIEIPYQQVVIHSPAEQKSARK